MYKKIVIFSSILILLAMFGGCSQSPTSIGTDLLSPDYIEALVLSSDTVAQSQTLNKEERNLGDGTRLLVGRLSELNTEAASLVEFLITPPDSIKKNYTVSSAWVQLTNTYMAGKAADPLTLQVYGIIKDWQSLTVKYSDITSGFYDNNDVSSNQSITDTVGGLTKFNISTSLVNSWVNDTSKNKGILIRSTANSKKVEGYQALSSTSTTFPNLYVVFSKPGAANDTLIFGTNQDVAVVNSTLPNGNDHFYAQGCSEIRTRLFFDVYNKIPPKSVINYAELVLAADTVNSVVASVSSKSIYLYNSTDSTIYDSVSTYYQLMSLDTGYYKANVTSLVQEWFSTSVNKNLGFIAAPYNIYNSVDVYSFYGMGNSNPALRPKLIIKYTRKK